MKCGKCGNNEATFHYKSMVNGEMTELCLCQECAGAEEFAGLFNMKSGFDEIFGNSFMRPFAQSMGAFAEPRSFFMPAFGFAPVVIAPYSAVPAVPKEGTEEKIPTEVDPAIAKRRELHALKHAMKEAVRAEEFEKAAELRDKIRAFESA